MQDEEWFRLLSTQEMMIDILFIFCKINDDVSYRQGMHELLAPVLWVVQNDAIKTESFELEDENRHLDLVDANFIGARCLCLVFQGHGDSTIVV